MTYFVLVVSGIIKIMKILSSQYNITSYHGLNGWIECTIATETRQSLDSGGHAQARIVRAKRL